MIDKKLKKELIVNTKFNFKLMNSHFQYFLKSIKHAESINQVMNLKVDLMLSIIDFLPLDTDTNYFCLKNRENCNICMYGKRSKKCIYIEVYSKVFKSLEKLKKAIYAYWNDQFYITTPFKKSYIKIVYTYIKINLNRLQSFQKMYLNNLKSAKYISELDVFKNDFLRSMLKCLPLTNKHCYFCLYVDTFCKKCEYAKLKGRNCFHEKSNYSRIVTMLENTNLVILKYIK